jgi:hypothetical protein
MNENRLGGHAARMEGTTNINISSKAGRKKTT